MLVLLLAALVTLLAAAPARAGSTVVTVDFDDGLASSARGAEVLEAHGLRGTFYVNTDLVGRPGHLTWAQVDALAAAGHELGGHTLGHERLEGLDPAEQRQAVCADRARLLARGHDARAFAYPFGAWDGAAERAVKDCGYASARWVGRTTQAGCTDPSCPTGEPLPVADPHRLRNPGSVEATDSLEELQRWVLETEAAGGGLVSYVLHDVCDGCQRYAITAERLDALLGWLRARGIPVRTTSAAIGTAAAPAVPLPAPRLRNGGLERSAGGGAVADCFERAGWGTNTASFARTPGAYGAEAAETVRVTGHASGDRKVMVRRLAGCAPWVAEGRRLRLSAWHRGTGTARWAVYWRDRDGRWQAGDLSPAVTLRDGWARATYVTEPAPRGVSQVVFGLALASDGELVTDDLAVADAATAEPGALTNASFEDDADANGLADCWERTGWGTGTPTWARLGADAGAPVGSFAERVGLSGHTSGDRKVMVRRDPRCAPPVTRGHRLTLGLHHRSTGPARWATYLRRTDGTWIAWELSDAVPATGGEWRRASFRTAPVPSGVTHVSFGLALAGDGELDVDGASVVED